MKLSASLTAQAARQLNSWVVPETHPANLSLCETFGEHTFFLDSEGLVIAEPSESDERGPSSRASSSSRPGPMKRAPNWRRIRARTPGC